MTQGDRLDRYFAVIAEHGYSPSTLRFYADYLFRGINLTGVMLDVGAGGGMFSVYSACAGAAWVVSLEPQVAGSASGMNEDFARIASLLGQDQVELVPKRLQDYEAGPESFHLLRLHASINHLDEDACTRLHHDPEAQDAYVELLRKLAASARSGAKADRCRLR
jgi:hypothetical protein